MNIFDDFHPDETLDFHDHKVRYDFEAVRLLNNFIEDAYFKKSRRLLVITGKGDIIRPAVKYQLGENKYVKSFKMAGYFSGQDGAFEVILKS